MKVAAVSSVDTIYSALQRHEHNVYLLLDGARFDDIFAFLYKTDSHPEYIPLYRGTYYESVMEGGPCLVKAPLKGNLLSWYIEEGAKEMKGLLLSSELPLQELAKHFQQFLEVRIQNKEVVLFRFYDPCVFHALAPFPNKQPIVQLLKPLQQVFWEKDATFYQLS